MPGKERKNTRENLVYGDLLPKNVLGSLGLLIREEARVKLLTTQLQEAIYGTDNPEINQAGDAVIDLGANMVALTSTENIQAAHASPDTRRWAFQKKLKGEVGSILTADEGDDYNKVRALTLKHVRFGREDALVPAAVLDQQFGLKAENQAGLEGTQVEQGVRELSFRVMEGIITKIMFNGYTDQTVQQIGEPISRYLAVISDNLPFYVMGKAVKGAGTLVAGVARKSKEFRGFVELRSQIQDTFGAWLDEHAAMDKDALAAKLPKMGYLGDLLEAYTLPEGDPNKWSKDETLAELIGFFMAALDTTYNMIQWMIVRLAENPQFLATDDLHGFTDIQGLAQAFAMELLRDRPSLPVNFVEFSQDFTTPNGQVIPKDTLAWLCVQTANHDPRLFRDPNTFDLSRYANISKTQRDQLYAAIRSVFKEGNAHQCVGKAFAEKVMQAVYLWFREHVSEIELSHPQVVSNDRGVQSPVAADENGNKTKELLRARFTLK